MDLNVRVIKAVECCPTLYKGHASIEERLVIWQQLAEQMRVPETVLKTRWHLLCAYYQRCLEKRRSTDEDKDSETGAVRSDFRYEKEMAFMMPYIHARITIAAANAARKQQELALAGANDLTEPEFVITEKDIEMATEISNQIAADYTFYEVDTIEQHHEDLEENSNGVIETQHEVFSEGDVIEHIDESGNIVMQNIIYEASEDGGEIEIGEEEILQMDDQIEVQNEQIIEEMVDDETHAEDESEYITESYTVSMATEVDDSTVQHLANNNALKIIKLPTENEIKPKETSPVAEIDSPFTQEYALMTRRRHAVVLKATPRVQVELTDNTVVVSANVVLDEQEKKPIEKSSAIEVPTVRPTIKIQQQGNLETAEQHPIEINASSSTENTTINNCLEIVEETQYTTEEQKSFSSPSTTVSSPTPISIAASTNDSSHKNERSEDTIFGELVTAMLRQMPPDRKRTIKKSIMDLLLT